MKSAPYCPSITSYVPLEPRHSTSQRRGPVLVIGKDTSLLWTRSHLMRGVGCRVFSALPEDVISTLAGNAFPIAIFGHSLSDEETAHLATFTRRAHPATTLLLLTSHPPRPAGVSSLFDQTIDMLEGHGALTQTVQALLARCA